MQVGSLRGAPMRLATVAAGLQTRCRRAGNGNDDDRVSEAAGRHVEGVLEVGPFEGEGRC